MKLPKGTLVESALEQPTARRGVPVWIWAVVGLAAIAGTYVFISRGGTWQNDALPVPVAPTETASDAPAQAPVDAGAGSNSQPEPAESNVAANTVTTPPSAAAPAPVSAKPVPDSKKPVAADDKSAVAKKTPDAGAPATHAVTPPVAKTGSKAIEQWKPNRPAAAAPVPLDSDASVAGVETWWKSRPPYPPRKSRPGRSFP